MVLGFDEIVACFILLGHVLNLVVWIAGFVLLFRSLLFAERFLFELVCMLWICV